MEIGAWIWIGLFVIGLILLIGYWKTRRFLRCLLFSAFSGLCGLGAVWVLGHFLELGLSVTPLTVGVAALLGIPGVVGLLLLRLI